MPNKIAYYIDSDNFGGAEQVLYTLLKGLNREKWQPLLIYHPSPGISPFIKAVEEIHVETLSTPLIKSYNDLCGLSSLTSKLRSLRPAIFHANINWPLSCNYGIVAAFLARVKVIIATQHLYNEIGWRRGRIEQKLISCLVDRYIAVSHDVARQLRNIIPFSHKVDVVHNGIMVKDYNNSSLNKPSSNVYSAIKKNRVNYPIALTVARLDKQKGHTYLLKAATEVPETLFVFVGDGPERENLKNETQNLGIDDRVIFLGMRYDIPELLQGCDVFVLPSLYEGLPLSIMEAMAAGKPVVATNIGGVNELIINRETGCLVPSANPNELASSIRFLTSNPSSALKMAMAGRNRIIQEFSAEKMVAEITEIYKTQISSKGDIHKRISTEYIA